MIRGSQPELPNGGPASEAPPSETDVRGELAELRGVVIATRSEIGLLDGKVERFGRALRKLRSGEVAAVGTLGLVGEKVWTSIQSGLDTHPTSTGILAAVALLMAWTHWRAPHQPR